MKQVRHCVVNKKVTQQSRRRRASASSPSHSPSDPRREWMEKKSLRWKISGAATIDPSCGSDRKQEAGWRTTIDAIWCCRCWFSECVECGGCLVHLCLVWLAVALHFFRCIFWDLSNGENSMTWLRTWGGNCDNKTNTDIYVEVEHNRTLTIN